MFIAMRVDYERYRDPRVILPLVGVTLLALVAVLVVGPEINGTHRWFAVAGRGHPAVGARQAGDHPVHGRGARAADGSDRQGRSTLSGPIVVVLVPMVGLILLQPDFGSSVALLAIVAVMVFAAGLPWRYIVYGRARRSCRS